MLPPRIDAGRWTTSAILIAALVLGEEDRGALVAAFGIYAALCRRVDIDLR